MKLSYVSFRRAGCSRIAAAASGPAATTAAAPGSGSSGATRPCAGSGTAGPSGWGRPAAPPAARTAVAAPARSRPPPAEAEQPAGTPGRDAPIQLTQRRQGVRPSTHRTVRRRGAYAITASAWNFAPQSCPASRPGPGSGARAASTHPRRRSGSWAPTLSSTAFSAFSATRRRRRRTGSVGRSRSIVGTRPLRREFGWQAAPRPMPLTCQCPLGDCRALSLRHHPRGNAWCMLWWTGSSCASDCRITCRTISPPNSRHACH